MKKFVKVSEFFTGDPAQAPCRGIKLLSVEQKRAGGSDLAEHPYLIRIDKQHQHTYVPRGLSHSYRNSITGKIR